MATVGGTEGEILHCWSLDT